MVAHADGEDSGPGRRDGTETRTGLTILVVDDDAAIHEMAARYLANEYRLLSAFNHHAAERALETHQVDLLLLDLNLPFGFATLLPVIRERFPDLPVIVITAFAAPHVVVDCMKRGAFDVLAKDADFMARVVGRIQPALQQRRRQRGSRATSADPEVVPSVERCSSAAMRATVDSLRGVAREAPVLLVGERGTGKCHLARFLHVVSSREGAFVVDRDVARADLADGGTLFVPDLDALSAAGQRRLSRLLARCEWQIDEQREPARVDVRLVAATTVAEPAALVERDRLRRDLWSAFGDRVVRVPPLRERREDLPALVRALAQRHHRAASEPPSWDAGTLAALAAYDWPDNVRELEFVVMQLLSRVRWGVIRLEDVPTSICLPYLERQGTPAAVHLRTWFQSTIVDDRARKWELAPREAQVFRLLAVGCSHEQVRDRLSMSEGTLKTEIARILEKAARATGEHTLRMGDLLRGLWRLAGLFE